MYSQPRVRLFQACAASNLLYIRTMATVPMTVRLDRDLISLLCEGRRRTPLSKQELVRRTLRLHLQKVIEAESKKLSSRVTRISPWPRVALAKAYKRTDEDWDRVEAAATAAQGKPSWND